MKLSSILVKIAVTEEKGTTTIVANGTPSVVVVTVLTISGVVDVDINCDNNGILDNSGLPGTSHHVLTHHTIRAGPIILPKMMLFVLHLNKLLSISTHLAQLTLNMLCSLSTLLSWTRFSIWTLIHFPLDVLAR